MTAYTTSSEIPVFVSPLTSRNVAHGMSTVPVPSTGRMSITAVNRATRKAYRMPMIEKATNSSVKVIAIMSVYAFAKLPTVSLQRVHMMPHFAAAFSGIREVILAFIALPSTVR